MFFLRGAVTGGNPQNNNRSSVAIALRLHWRLSSPWLSCFPLWSVVQIWRVPFFVPQSLGSWNRVELSHSQFPNYILHGGFKHYLVGGLEHFLFFHIILGISSSQLTFIFFRGVETTNQYYMAVSKIMIVHVYLGITNYYVFDVSVCLKRVSQMHWFLMNFTIQIAIICGCPPCSDKSQNILLAIIIWIYIYICW